MKTSRILPAFLCILAAAFVSCSRSNPEAVPAEPPHTRPAVEDHSLTIDEYLRLGMPAPDRAWSPQDYSQAATVLKSIAQKNPRELPRSGSPASGKLFERIASTENLAPLLDEKLSLDTRMPMMIGYLDGSRQVMTDYLDPATRGFVFDSEVAGLMGLMLKLGETSIGLGNKFMASVPKDDPKMSVRQEGFSKMKSGLVTTFDGAIISLSETNFYGTPARLKVCGYLRDTLPSVINEFPSNVQSEIPVRIGRLQEIESDAQMKKELEELRNAVTAALAH
jgi:hypothetical protein